MARPGERKEIVHGTRSRFLHQGCRCEPCKEANRRYHRERKARIASRMALLTPTSAPLVVEFQESRRTVKRRLCPGANGQPCVRKGGPARLQPSMGEVCRRCAERHHTMGFLVSSDEVRAHLLALRKAGVGRRSVAAACDVPDHVLLRIVRYGGRIDKAVADKILAVDEGAASDQALASPEQVTRIRAILAELRKMGFRVHEIARLSGVKKSARPKFGESGNARIGSLARLERLLRKAQKGEVQPRPGYVPGAPIYRIAQQLIDDGWIRRKELEERARYDFRPKAPKLILRKSAERILELKRALEKERLANEEREKAFDRLRFGLARNGSAMTA